MPRYGDPGGGRSRGKRYRPYGTIRLPTQASHGNRTRKDDHYGPNENLFDRESVLDMVSSGISSASLTFDSDCENSEPTGTEGTSFSHEQPLVSGRNTIPTTSTPLREHNPPQPYSFGHDGIERQHGLQPHDIVAMLQEQQQLLQTLIRSQESMKECQSAFDRKLTTLQQQVSNVSTSCPTSSSEDKKCKVTRDLTRKVSAVHETLEEGFRPFESSTTQHNRSIKSKILEEISSTPNNPYPDSSIRAAVQRKYEYMRRLFTLEEAQDCEVVKKETALKKKYRQRRKRKFDNRALVVRESEMKHWKQLSVNYMTEESDDPDESTAIIFHPLPWRSEKLNNFLATLDKRYSEKIKGEGVLMAKKLRRPGSNSSLLPPTGAPAWTLNEAWKDQPK